MAVSRTLLQQLVACLNFTSDAGVLFFFYNQKKSFLWAMAVAQAAKGDGDEWDFLPDIYDDGY